MLHTHQLGCSGPIVDLIPSECLIMRLLFGRATATVVALMCAVEESPEPPRWLSDEDLQLHGEGLPRTDQDEELHGEAMEWPDGPHIWREPMRMNYGTEVETVIIDLKEVRARRAAAEAGVDVLGGGHDG